MHIKKLSAMNRTSLKDLCGPRMVPCLLHDAEKVLPILPLRSRWIHSMRIRTELGPYGNLCTGEPTGATGKCFLFSILTEICAYQLGAGHCGSEFRVDEAVASDQRESGSAR